MKKICVVDDFRANVLKHCSVILKSKQHPMEHVESNRVDKNVFKIFTLIKQKKVLLKH